MDSEISQLILKIKAALDAPAELEILYRDNSKSFERAFLNIWPDYTLHPVAQCWYYRFKPKSAALPKFSKRLWIPALGSALCTQLPWIFGLDESFFFSRNIGLITIPFIWAVYFNLQVNRKPHIITLYLLAALCCISINTMPADASSQSYILSCIHIPLLLWIMGGLGFQNIDLKTRAFSFFRFTSDFILFTGLMGIAGFIFSALCVALFNLIKIPVEIIYFKHMALPAAAIMLCAAAFSVYLPQNSVSGMAQRIAKWFSPAVLLALLIYVPAVIFADKNPFFDRDVLVILNATLIAVLAVVLNLFISLDNMTIFWYNRVLILGLIGLSLLLDTIVLCAVCFRIFEWGLSANKCALLLENTIIFSHLISLGILFISAKHKKNAFENNLRRFIWIYSFCFAIIGLGFRWIF